MSRRSILGWALYDFANSAFATTVMAVVYGVYYSGTVVGPEGVVIGGYRIPGASMWAYTVSLSMALVCLVAPLMGAMADATGGRKRYLLGHAAVGSIATFLLCTVDPGEVWLGAGLFFVANLAFANGNVFYNAMLPELASESTLGRVSGLGWALGYIGGGLCLVLNLVIIKNPGLLGLEGAVAGVQASMVTVGLWWALFSLPLLFWVKEKRHPAGQGALAAMAAGVGRLKSTFREIRRYRELAKFLVAFLLYNDAVETVILMASVFGAEVLAMTQGEIIACYLMIQAVAFVGSLLFGVLADRIGTLRSVVLSLVIWAIIAAWAVFMQSKAEFWMMGVLVGLVLGGTQSASRTLQARFAPQGKQAEFFGFFAVSGKVATVLGPAIFGIIRQVTGSLRISAFFLLLLVLAGLAVLLTVREKEGMAAARGEDPLVRENGVGV